MRARYLIGVQRHSLKMCQIHDAWGKHALYASISGGVWLLSDWLIGWGWLFGLIVIVGLSVWDGIVVAGHRRRRYHGGTRDLYADEVHGTRTVIPPELMLGAVRFLVERLDSESMEVRDQAEEALGKLRLGGSRKDPAAWRRWLEEQEGRE